MKKIMIIAAVALCAFCSQAASFRWNASGVQNAAGTGTFTGTATLYSYAATGTEADAVAVSTAEMRNGAIALTTFSDTDNFTVGQQYVFYYTMQDTAGNVFTSATKNGAAQQSASAMLAFGNGGSWSTADIPEPTSGLLLLVGVAGLALRRKRK